MLILKEFYLKGSSGTEKANDNFIQWKLRRWASRNGYTTSSFVDASLWIRERLGTVVARCYNTESGKDEDIKDIKSVCHNLTKNIYGDFLKITRCDESTILVFEVFKNFTAVFMVTTTWTDEVWGEEEETYYKTLHEIEYDISEGKTQYAHAVDENTAKETGEKTANITKVDLKEQVFWCGEKKYVCFGHGFIEHDRAKTFPYF